MKKKTDSIDVFIQYYGCAVKALLDGKSGNEYLDKDFPDAVADDGLRLAIAMFMNHKNREKRRK